MCSSDLIPLIGGFFKTEPEQLGVPLTASEKDAWQRINIAIAEEVDMANEEGRNKPTDDELIKLMKGSALFMGLNTIARKALIKLIKSEY